MEDERLQEVVGELIHLPSAHRGKDETCPPGINLCPEKLCQVNQVPERQGSMFFHASQEEKTLGWHIKSSHKIYASQCHFPCWL